jgi:C-terminal processing protease CtpA/Prc
MDFPSSPTRNKAEWSRTHGHVFLPDQHPGEPFWCVNIASARSIYCDFRSYTGLSKHSTAMLNLIAQAAPEKLVIDMRDNGGGDYTVGERNLIRPIKRLESINRRGHLFVLIGSQTFSAAMNNAAQFRAQTAATLVGETIGEKPNSYQEPREMRLPNSKLVVRYSTRWYAFVESGPNTIEPDVPVPQSWADYADGQDSALNYVLALPPESRN